MVENAIQACLSRTSLLLQTSWHQGIPRSVALTWQGVLETFPLSPRFSPVSLPRSLSTSCRLCLADPPTFPSQRRGN